MQATAAHTEQQPKAPRFHLVPKEVTAETDYDGDGHWDTRTISSYVYNEDLQVIESTTVYEYDYNADGIADSRTINTLTYDPTIITAEEIMTKSAVQKAAAPSNNSVFGAVLSNTEAWYNSNETSGEIAEYPYKRVEESYTYTDEGKVLSYSKTESLYNDEDEALTSSSTNTITKTYNEDGKTIEKSDSWTRDYDGDGVADSSISTVCTMSYDSKRLFHKPKVARGQKMVATLLSTKWPATHTYTDGLLTQTTVTETGEQPYTLDFTYNDDGLVATKTKSFNNYGDSGIDTYYKLTFSYDSEGRVTGYTHRYEHDSNDDEVIDYFQEYLYTFSYDENARILTSNYQYRYDNTPTDNEYTVNHLNTNTYSYTDDGLSFIPWFYPLERCESGWWNWTTWVPPEISNTPMKTVILLH